MLRPMSNPRRMRRAKWQEHVRRDPRRRRNRSGSLTFSNDFLEYDANQHNQPRRQFVARYEDELSI